LYPPLYKQEDVPFAVLADVTLEFDHAGIPYFDPEQVAFHRQRGGGDSRVSKDIQVVIRDPKFFKHYFHFMETFLTLYAVWQEVCPGANITHVVLGQTNWNNPKHANVQSRMFATVFPNAEIVARNFDLPRDNNVIYIDRELTRTSINKMLDPSLFLVAKWAPELRRTIFRALGIDVLNNKRKLVREVPDILYVPRIPPRCLNETVEREVLGSLAKFGNVESIRFEDLTWEEQVKAAARSDILVGVHGNGLTNLLWLPSHGMAIELFNENVHQYDYQMLAEAMQVDYFGIEGERLHRSFSREWRVYGNVGRAVNIVPTKNLEFAFNSFSLRKRAGSLES
jgi:hypothetical protein